MFAPTSHFWRQSESCPNLRAETHIFTLKKNEITQIFLRISEKKFADHKRWPHPPLYGQKCQNAIKCQKACTSGQGHASDYFIIL